MSFHNDGQNVRTCAGIVLWDGVNQPGSDDHTGAVVHSLKIAIPENAQEKAELEQLAMQAVTNSEFKGQFPAGGSWPIMGIDLSKYGDSAPLLQGRVAVNAKTRNGIPKVFDANGQELAPMQLGQMLYPGAVVEVLVHAYTFNNKSKGVGYGLDGIMVIDATAPKLDVGGGMSSQQVAAAFGATGQQPAGMPPGGQQPAGMPPGGNVAPNPGFVQNAGGQQPRVMTGKANGATYEQFVAQGWTDEMMIREGYLQA